MNHEVGKNDIWFKYDLENKKFVKMIFQDSEFDIDLDSELSKELQTTFQFILDYSKSAQVTQDEILKLINFMLSKIGSTDYVNNFVEKFDSETPSTLRKIAYEAVKNVLEEKHEGNLDDITVNIVENCKSNYSLDSVRSSVSAVLSALRNTFTEVGIESWNEPIWRGKKTGRNPHIKVPENFKMPSYAMLWENYKIYLKKN